MCWCDSSSLASFSFLNPCAFQRLGEVAIVNQRFAAQFVIILQLLIAERA
jgi:hypothetical protein